MAEIITSDDLPAAIQSHELVDLLVAGANAKASRVAPCLTWADEDADHPAPSADTLAEAKLVLVGAIKRWAEAGSGALSAQTAGPFGQTIDTRQRVGFNLWPSEITQLQDVCSSDDNPSGAFTVDTVSCGTDHSEVCSLYFGATYCSCGADIAGYPLFEVFP